MAALYSPGVAYPTGSARVCLRGTVSDGEVFQTTFGLSNVIVANNTEANTLAGVIASHFVTDLYPNLKTLINADTSYTTVVVYCYNGGTVAEFIGTATLSSGVGTGANVLPLQTCLVMTLQTGIAGRQNRGRMYLPANGATMAAGHLFDNTFPTTIPGVFATFFNHIATDVTASAQPSVISLKSSSAHAITSVSVNTKPDIQRRRADKQPNGITTVHSVP